MSNTSIRRRACQVVADAVLAVAAMHSFPTAALAQENPGYRIYRCAVLGDTGGCPASPVVPDDRIEVQTLAGPYARYLMHVGFESSRAMEAARAIGEVPVRRTVRFITRQLTAFEAYELYHGRLTTPRTRQVILAEAPVEDAATQACATVCDNEVR